MIALFKIVYNLIPCLYVNLLKFTINGTLHLDDIQKALKFNTFITQPEKLIYILIKFDTEAEI
jgi:hypothetical protein